MTFPERGPVQITFDCADPTALATFWAAVLNCEPPDVEEINARLRKSGVPDEDLNKWSLIGTADGLRLFFQKVPEGKTAKNRVHLDVRASGHGRSDRATIDERVSELLKLGARKIQGVDDFDTYFVVMQDPEGNEFCID